MTHGNDPATPTERFADNFDKIKAEGDIRFKKITQILRAAIAKSASELKEGATVVSPATKDFRDSVIQRVKETSQETLDEAQEVWANRAKEESFQDWFRAEIQAAVNAMKTTLKKDASQGKRPMANPPEKRLGES
ncbi:MAG: hypothetical protein ACFB2W_21645 [Leptolyngbyaceae cyanobacterium]